MQDRLDGMHIHKNKQANKPTVINLEHMLILSVGKLNLNLYVSRVGIPAGSLLNGQRLRQLSISNRTLVIRLLISDLWCHSALEKKRRQLVEKMDGRLGKNIQTGCNTQIGFSSAEPKAQR